ncbi:hypothetical protein BX070DRAFT_194597 [Coemansia spiralis]|nr:hypothetical protein BX070DRAFT_194597 [Coemansia spiralis]
MAHRRSTTAVAPRSAEEADAGPRPSADAEKRPWDSPRLGSLAASLLDPAQPRDPRLRFLLHSPAGVLEAATLAELRTGSITLADIVARGGFWLDIADPTPSEMAAVARVFRIHPLTVEDILADDGRDKLESFHGYSFLAYRTIDRADSRSSYEFNTTDGLATAGFALVLKPSCVLTFHRGGLEHTDNTVARLRGLAHSTPTYIAYALVDDITDSLAPEMRALELEVDAVDELVLILSTNEQSDMLRRIGAARRKILTVWRLLQGKPEAIRALAKLVDASEPIDIARYLDDVHDHLVSLTASVAHCDLVLARAHSNYLARLSLELGESTVATNLFASRWTVIGAILVPLNVITGLWGMNVKVPGQDRDDTRDFFLILAGCLLFVALVIVWARCKRIF